MPSKRVLVTGATGYVANQILPELRRRYELVLADVKTKNAQGQEVAGIKIADLAGADRAPFAALFEGVDAVVHLAYRKPAEKAIDAFDMEHDNVRTAYNVFRAASDAGARRVVCASSVHAADFYEGLVRERKMEIVDPYTLPLAEGFYGWAKVAMEQMGFVFANGKLGRKLEVVMVRIASPNDNKVLNNHSPSGLRMYLGSYVSPRDLAQLFVRAIDAPNIENEHGVPWQVVYGVSNNTRAYYSLANARRILGYEPQDDSEVKFAEIVKERLTDKGHTGRLGAG